MPITKVIKKYIYIQAKENMIWSDSFYEVDHLPMLIPSDHPKKIFDGTVPTLLAFVCCTEHIRLLGTLPPLKDLAREIPNGFIDTSNCRQGSLAASKMLL